MKHWEQTLATYVSTIATSRSTFATSVRNSRNIPLKHLKHFKCTLATCIMSWCGLLRRQHRGTPAVAGGEAGGLPRQGPTLLLALAMSLGGTGSGAGAMARAVGPPKYILQSMILMFYYLIKLKSFAPL